MAQHRVSAKFTAFLKDRSLLFSKANPALLSQVPSRAPSSSASIRTCTNVCPSTYSHGALQPHLFSNAPITRQNVMHVQSCLISPAHICHMEIISTRSALPRAGDLNPWLHFAKCGFPISGFDFHRGSLSRARSLSAVASSQDAEIQPEISCTSQALKIHTSESEVVNVSSSKVCAEPTYKEHSANSKEAGNTHEEALLAFEALLDRMEESAGTSDHKVGATCLRLAQLCDSADVEPARILSYGQRALKVFGSAKVSWEHVACLHVIGHAYFNMGEFENSVAHLEKSASILKKLKATVNEQDINTIKHAGQTLLGQAKSSLGRHGEALPHFQQSIKLAEKLLEPGNPDLGVSYLQAAQVYKEAKDPDEAICFCIKALENHANYYGPRSSQAADIRRFMSVVYFDLREYENALSEYETVRPILEGLGKYEEVASLDLVAVESLFQLEKFEEAISKLKGVINDTAATSPSHSNALILLAKAYAMLKNDESAATYCKKALHVLENQKPSLDTGASFVSLALVYQRQQEIELATSTYKKALETFNQFTGHQASAAVADIEGQIGFLLLHVEKADEALPFLERSVSKKRSIHGAESEELLDVHNHLGVGYSQEGKLDEALEQFEAAKIILSKNITEVDSLTISIYSNLANMYGVFGRFDEAIESQKTVIDSMKRNRDVETMVSLREAEKTLEDLQREAEARKSRQCED